MNFQYNNKKLIAYSVFTASFLFLKKEAEAQVIYVDIEPDLVFDEALEGDALDLDGDDTFDFAFRNNSFTFTTLYFFDPWIMQNILVGPEIINNGMAGISQFYSTGYGGFTWYFPFAFASGEKIGESLNWETSDVQIMALRSIHPNGLYMNNFGYWLVESQPEILGHYLGIRFLDTQENNHYGWIRCDVKDEGRTLVVKDYAYEIKPDWPIYAGDTISYINIEEHENPFGAIVYSFDKNVYVKITDEDKALSLNIYDLEGKSVYEKELETAFHVINVEQFNPGIYLVELLNEEGKYVKKVLIE